MDNIIITEAKPIVLSNFDDTILNESSIDSRSNPKDTISNTSSCALTHRMPAIPHPNLDIVIRHKTGQLFKPTCKTKQKKLNKQEKRLKAAQKKMIDSKFKLKHFYYYKQDDRFFISKLTLNPSPIKYVSFRTHILPLNQNTYSPFGAAEEVK